MSGSASTSGPATGVTAQPGLRSRAAELAQRLPRETRDTLFLLLVIGVTLAPHLLHLPPWCGAMALLVLAWRARIALTGAALPGRWVVTGLLIVAAVLTLWGERSMLGREAGVTMLVVLMALKTLELRARRDALVVFFLGFFLLLTNFLYSQKLLIGLWMLVALWGLLTSLVLAHMPVGRPPLARAAAVAARATALGIPVMVVLFVLFPRIGPLWGLPQDAQGRTGLSGSLRMGGVAEIAEDDSIAFRVRFLGPAPTPDQLYFRGPVLVAFDGREWTRGNPSVPVAQRPRAELQQRGPALRYEITLEPTRLPLLPLLELTPDLPGLAPALPGWMLLLRGDAQWQTDRPIDERVRLEAAAWLDPVHGPLNPVPGLRDHLRLPQGANPRTRAWAEALRARPDLAGADATTLARAVMEHVRSGGFSYTLAPGTYGVDAVDEFWLDRKLGFCEHFAAAFVVVMRSLDVPARIVTGYQGTDPPAPDGWRVVRQSHAHAWAEYWQAGRGWVRADPTAAVAPERVRASRNLRPPPGLVAGALNTIDPALADRLRRAWETLENAWNQRVLNFSRGQQFDLLRALGLETPTWRDLASVLVLLLAGAALAGAAWAVWDRRRQDPWQRLQQRVQQLLAALGVAVAAHDPPHTRARKVRAALGERGAALADALDALAHARYAGTASGPLVRWWPRLRAAARQAQTATR
jgi:transglutaminase-like putative cysteine protease